MFNLNLVYLRLIQNFSIRSNYSVRDESEQHPFANVEQPAQDDDGDEDQVEDLSMARKTEKISPPPSPVSVASAPNSDAAIPAQTGVIVPPQK